MQNNNEYGSYPNTEFPYKYTKAGQKAMMEKYTGGESYDTQITTQSTPPENKSNNIDISKILPLLMNKNLNNNDLLEILLPMINKNNLPIKDMLEMTKKSEPSRNPLPDSEPIITQGYKKVE